MTENAPGLLPPPIHLVRGLGGAVLGGTIGFFLFWAILRQGFWAGMLPGTLLGAGCGVLSGTRSHLLAAVCAGCGVALGIWSEWFLMPFARDESLIFFLRNLTQLPSAKLLMIGLGGVLAYSCGLGRAGRRIGQKSLG